MKISGNENFQYYYGLNNKKDITTEEKKELYNARKENATLDRALYLSDLAELYKDMGKAEAIAKKVAKGESISKEEREFMEEEYVDQLKEAEKAKNRAEKIEEKAKNADSKAELQSIMMMAASEVNQSIESGNEAYGQLLMEAVRSKLSQYNENTSKYNYKYNNNKNNIDYKC